jgi:DNA-binding transcriptional ArsR family regulator
MSRKNELPHEHGQLHKDLLEHIPPAADIAVVAEAFKQLGDPTRLRIFWILCHCEECVTDIAAMLGMSSPAVSHHLRLLKQSGLIVSRRAGKETFYTAAAGELPELLHRSIETVAHITCPKKSD